MTNLTNNLHCYIYSSDEGLVAKFYQTMKPEPNSNPLAELANEAALKRWQLSCVKTVKVCPSEVKKIKEYIESPTLLGNMFRYGFKEGAYFKNAVLRMRDNQEYAFLSDNKREEKEESQGDLLLELIAILWSGPDGSYKGITASEEIESKFTISRK